MTWPTAPPQLNVRPLTMPTLQDRIADKFIETLQASDAITKLQVKQLQELLATGKKVKPDDLVAILTASDGAVIK